MKVMTKLLCAGAALLALSSVQTASAAEEPNPRIQIAILLDTSNSMDGLIAQAKSQLWQIVNEFIAVKKDGKRPELEVALYEYGKSTLPPGEGYLRMIAPLTTDLDKLSEELFVLTTNGGQEYCGKVIQVATVELDWSPSNDDLKLIFIAGNEPFTQGDVDYRKACKAAIAKGIIVNTIHCGPHGTGVSGKWKDGAELADGKYMCIDQNRQTVHIAAPQDTEIVRLGEQLTKTYISYGAQGQAGRARQAAQELNAQSASQGSYLQRQITKASPYYRNTAWDLVDAMKEGKIKLEEVKDKDLPEEMQKMTDEEKTAFVKAQAKKRAEIQTRISKLDAERKQYVAQKMKDLSKSGEDTLDAAMIKAVRTQAGQKNFKFE